MSFKKACFAVSSQKYFFHVYTLFDFLGRKVKDCEKKKKLWGRALPQSSSIEIVTEVYFHFAEKTKKKKEIIYQKRTKKKQKEFPAQNLPVGEVPASNVTRILKWFCLPR